MAANENPAKGANTMKRKNPSPKTPLIALLTDFGSSDWFAASMKAVIKQILPNAEIIDITHNVEPHNILAASFILESCYRDFPEGAIFCCVVDPGVGSKRKRLAATDGTYFFLAPDNGLLTSVEARSEIWLMYSIINKELRHQGPGATFEARDVFAPAAAHLASGVKIDSLGPLYKDMKRLDLWHPKKEGKNSLTALMIYIDRFGNLVTNIAPDDLPSSCDPARIVVAIKKRKIKGIHKSYSDVKPGQTVLYWGSTGRLEIGVNLGNAASLFTIGYGDKISLYYQNS